MEIPDVIAISGVVVALATIVWQNNANYKQNQLQNFTIYTERYQNIFLHLPIDITSDRLKLRHLGSHKYESTLRWLRAYFDLCSEEYHLHKHELVDENVWVLWKDGMSDCMKRPAFSEAWRIFQQNQYYSKEFSDFVEPFMNSDFETK